MKNATAISVVYYSWAVCMGMRFSGPAAQASWGAQPPAPLTGLGSLSSDPTSTQASSREHGRQTPSRGQTQALECWADRRTCPLAHTVICSNTQSHVLTRGDRLATQSQGPATIAPRR